MLRSVTQWLEKTESLNPDKTVFTDTEKSITYRELLQSARAVGTCLSSCTGTRKPVVVMSGRHVMTPAAYLGVVYSGCFYAPVDADMPESRLNKILELISADIMLVDRQHASLAAQLNFKGKIIILEDALETEPDERKLEDIQRSMTLTDPLYVIFTSGSSGIPKGVITSTQSLVNYIEAVNEVMKIDSEDVLGNQSPLDYIAAIRDIYLPIMTGASTVIIPKSLFMIPAQLFDYINKYKVTVLFWTVSALTLPTSLGAFEHCVPESVKKVCFSGAVMPCATLRIWQDNLPEAMFVNQYGPTETTASCTYYAVTHLVDKDETLPIGRPYKNYRVFILTDEGKEAACGEQGEICIGGIGLALGYYNDVERTAASFVKNPLNPYYEEKIYKSGDIGVMRDDGILEFHGRRDRQIKHLGHRVELDEIDIAAAGIDGVESSLCLYCEKSEQLNLFYTGEADKRTVALGLRECLPAFMVPRKIMHLDEMPRLANGKTDIQSLKLYLK